MHPIFKRMFVAPTSFKPLAYEGTTENDRWKNGVLRVIDDGISYPVRDGVADFVSHSVEAWSESDIEEIRKGNWIIRNWENQVAEAQTASKRTEFFKLLAESDGAILDIASGPGGGNMPGTVHYNPDSKVLMSDLGARVLHEWQGFLKNNGLGSNVCFAAFDATSMPIRSNSLDIVTSRGGFSNVPKTHEAIEEASRVLKRSGVLLISEGRITQESLSHLPKKLQNEWNKMFPHLGHSYEQLLRESGFSVESYSEAQQHALKPDEAELPRLAAEYGVTLYIVYGVTLYIVECCIQATKK